MAEQASTVTREVLSSAELLSELNAAGIERWLEGDQLRYRAANGAMTRERADYITRHKPQLVRLLQSKAVGSELKKGR